MIAKLTGVVDSLAADSCIIDVGGVGYHAFASRRTLDRLSVGQPAVLQIETHVREDHFHLFGFIDQPERDWFRLLTSVQGVGGRVALAILGALNIVANNNSATFELITTAVEGANGGGTP